MILNEIAQNIVDEKFIDYCISVRKQLYVLRRNRSEKFMNLEIWFNNLTLNIPTLLWHTGFKDACTILKHKIDGTMWPLPTKVNIQQLQDQFAYIADKCDKMINITLIDIDRDDSNISKSIDITTRSCRQMLDYIRNEFINDFN